MTTTVFFQRDSLCAGTGHIGINVTVNASPTFTRTYEVDELLSPITEDEKDAAIKVVLRMHFKGITKAAANAALIAGVTLVI